MYAALCGNYCVCVFFDTTLAKWANKFLDPNPSMASGLVPFKYVLLLIRSAKNTYLNVNINMKKVAYAHDFIIYEK